MKNHKKWLLSVILFSTLLLPLGVHAQDRETEVTETETSSLVTTAEEKAYRFYNVKTKQHLYTSNEAEKNALQASGWKYEGIAWSVE